MFSISVIIPVYNEEKTFLKILEKYNPLKKNINFELIIVNDGSNDNTKNLIENNSSMFDKVIHLSKNKGKGKAVREGLKIAKNEYIFIQDADLEYDPNDLNNFIKLAKTNNSDFVMGSRFSSTTTTPLLDILGNKLVTFIFNVINNASFSDICCCYCLFKKNNLPINYLKSNGWGQHIEMLTYVLYNSKKIVETPVYYNGRRISEGKKIRYRHVFGIIYFIIFSKIVILFKRKNLVIK